MWQVLTYQLMKQPNLDQQDGTLTTSLGYTCIKSTFLYVQHDFRIFQKCLCIFKLIYYRQLNSIGHLLRKSLQSESHHHNHRYLVYNGKLFINSFLHQLYKNSIAQVTHTRLIRHKNEIPDNLWQMKKQYEQAIYVEIFF